MINSLRALCLIFSAAIIGGVAFADYHSSPLHLAVEKGDAPEESDDTRPQVRVFGSWKEWDYGAWTLVQSDDEFDGISYFVWSDIVKPGISLDFPFHNTTARIFFDCGRSDVSMLVNILNGRLSAHYRNNWARVRYKFDGVTVKTDNWRLTEDWEATYPATGEADFIRRIMEHKFLVLELNMYGNARRRFRFDLDGSAMAIAELRKKCRKAE